MDQAVKTGICISCGFLCRRDILNRHLPLYYEITQEDRDAGRWFPGREHHYAPWCFRDVPILAEIQEVSGVTVPRNDPPDQQLAEQRRQNEAAGEVIKKERACPLWIQYKPGLGPEPHLGGLAMQELEQRRVEFERHMEQDRRKFQEFLEDQRQAFEYQLEASRREFTMALSAANERFQKSSASLGHWLAGAAIILALAQVTAALAGLTCDSLLWKWLALTAPGCPSP